MPTQSGVLRLNWKRCNPPPPPPPLANAAQPPRVGEGGSQLGNAGPAGPVHTMPTGTIRKLGRMRHQYVSRKVVIGILLVTMAEGPAIGTGFTGEQRGHTCHRPAVPAGYTPVSVTVSLTDQERPATTRHKAMSRRTNCITSAVVPPLKNWGEGKSLSSKGKVDPPRLPVHAVQTIPPRLFFCSGVQVLSVRSQVKQTWK